MNTHTLRLRITLLPRRTLSPALWLTGALLLGLLVAVQAGAVPVTAHDWLAIMGLGDSANHPAGVYVLWHLRLPRAFFAMLVGASMGMAGALTQGLFRNPLADPGLLGVTAGAACFAALTIVVFSGLALPIPLNWRPWLLPAAAFAGALGVCFALDQVARWITPGSIAGLLLTGVALNALAAAIIGLCTYLASDEQLRSLSFWTLGSLSGASWTLVLLMATLLALAGWSVSRLVRAMNALALGESAAGHVGVDVNRLRTHVIVWVALLAGCAVAWCGMIGFIGLVAPHLVRTWAGADQRQVVPLSMLMGGLLLLLADTLARTVAIPAEIPVGIFTALLGSPFFLLLLRSTRSRIG
jgi:iron complex transport system permease protein